MYFKDVLNSSKDLRSHSNHIEVVFKSTFDIELNVFSMKCLILKEGIVDLDKLISRRGIDKCSKRVKMY